jgi:hypothetical protein
MYTIKAAEQSAFQATDISTHQTANKASYWPAFPTAINSTHQTASKASYWATIATTFRPTVETTCAKTNRSADTSAYPSTIVAAFVEAIV